MELLLDVREERANFLLELLQQFEFVSIKNKTEESITNSEFVKKILTGRNENLNKNSFPSNTKKKPSDFVGCISKEIGLQMINDIENSRNEWERNI
jgi:hypothetical protein